MQWMLWDSGSQSRISRKAAPILLGNLQKCKFLSPTSAVGWGRNRQGTAIYVLKSTLGVFDAVQNLRNIALGHKTCSQNHLKGLQKSIASPHSQRFFQMKVIPVTASITLYHFLKVYQSRSYLSFCSSRVGAMPYSSSYLSWHLESCLTRN